MSVSQALNSVSDFISPSVSESTSTQSSSSAGVVPSDKADKLDWLDKFEAAVQTLLADSQSSDALASSDLKGQAQNPAVFLKAEESGSELQGQETSALLGFFNALNASTLETSIEGACEEAEDASTEGTDEALLLRLLESQTALPLINQTSLINQEQDQTLLIDPALLRACRKIDEAMPALILAQAQFAGNQNDFSRGSVESSSDDPFLRLADTWISTETEGQASMQFDQRLLEAFKVTSSDAQATHLLFGESGSYGSFSESFDAASLTSLSAPLSTQAKFDSASSSEFLRFSDEINLPFSSENWHEALSDKLAVYVNQKLNQVELKLNPESLGPIDIKISYKADEANLSFIVHNAETKEAILLSSDRLKTLFENQGLQLGSFDVKTGQENKDQSALFSQSDDSAQGRKASADLEEQKREEESSSLHKKNISPILVSRGISVWI